MIRCFAPEAQLYLQLKNGSTEVAGASASLTMRQDNNDIGEPYIAQIHKMSFKVARDLQCISAQYY